MTSSFFELLRVVLNGLPVPAAIMGASPGMLGTARAQYHLRQIFVTLNMYPLNKPEVMISKAPEKFDGDGNLTDETTKERIRQLVQALVLWTRRQKEIQVATRA